MLLDRFIMAQETGDDEEIAFQIKTHPALKEFPPHYRNGFKLLVSRIKVTSFHDVFKTSKITIQYVSNDSLIKI